MLHLFTVRKQTDTFSQIVSSRKKSAFIASCFGWFILEGYLGKAAFHIFTFLHFPFAAL